MRYIYLDDIRVYMYVIFIHGLSIQYLYMYDLYLSAISVHIHYIRIFNICRTHSKAIVTECSFICMFDILVSQDRTGYGYMDIILQGR